MGEPGPTGRHRNVHSGSRLCENATALSCGEKCILQPLSVTPGWSGQILQGESLGKIRGIFEFFSAGGTASFSLVAEGEADKKICSLATSRFLSAGERTLFRAGCLGRCRERQTAPVSLRKGLGRGLTKRVPGTRREKPPGSRPAMTPRDSSIRHCNIRSTTESWPVYSPSTKRVGYFGIGRAIALSLARSPTHRVSPAGSIAVGRVRPSRMVTTVA